MPSEGWPPLGTGDSRGSPAAGLLTEAPGRPRPLSRAEGLRLRAPVGSWPVSRPPQSFKPVGRGCSLHSPRVDCVA